MRVSLAAAATVLLALLSAAATTALQGLTLQPAFVASPSPSPQRSPNPSPLRASPQSRSPSFSPSPISRSPSPAAASDLAAPDPAPPEPGLRLLPYIRSWFFPGPAEPVNGSTWSLSMPDNPWKWYLEPESGFYRQPQNRHMFGPLRTLPSVLLMNTTISLISGGHERGSQGALFFHQRPYFDGGAELGWVYFTRNKMLQTYFLINANLPTGQLWSAHTAPDTAYEDKQLAYRMALNSTTKKMSVRVYNSSGSDLYNWVDSWPSWFKYNASLPWYVTVTWQRAENATIAGTLTNASLWYKP